MEPGEILEILMPEPTKQVRPAWSILRQSQLPEDAYQGMLARVEPGLYQRIHRSESHQIEAGTRLPSYLLKLNPVGRPTRGTANKPRVVRHVAVLSLQARPIHPAFERCGHPEWRSADAFGRSIGGNRHRSDASYG